MFTAQCSSRWRCFSINRALVLRGGALGDFILTLPVVRALRSEFDEVDIVANRRFAELAGNPAWALDDPELARFFVAGAELPRRWHEYFKECDLVISYLHDPEEIFARNVRACGVGEFITGPYRIESGSHATEQLARPLRRLGIAINDLAPKLTLTDREISDPRAEFALPLLALHPSSGSARKNWPIEKWIELIRDRLDAGERVVIIGGEADEREIATLRGQFADRVSYVLDSPLRRLAALLHGSTFIGHDSGISHLAAAAGAHCTILFGPTDPNVWSPRGEHVRVIVAPEGDFSRITVAQVRHALSRPLGSGSASDEAPAVQF